MLAARWLAQHNGGVHGSVACADGLGGLLTIVGTFLGHRWQTLEARRGRQEVHEREDRYRLHQDRRVAYVGFHLALGNARSVFSDVEAGAAQDWLLKVREARAEAWVALVPLWHVGSERVVDAAAKIMNHIDAVAWRGKEVDLDTWSALMEEYVIAVRSDLLGANMGFTSVARNWWHIKPSPESPSG